MVIAGIILSSMHQSSLGSLFVIMVPRLQSLWYSIIQPEFFLVSSLAAGISTIIIGSFISIRLYGQTLSEKVIEKLGRLLPWILGLYLIMKLGELTLTGTAGPAFHQRNIQRLVPVRIGYRGGYPYHLVLHQENTFEPHRAR